MDSGLTNIKNVEEWMIWEEWLYESKSCFGLILLYRINFSERHLDIRAWKLRES